MWQLNAQGSTWYECIVWNEAVREIQSPIVYTPLVLTTGSSILLTIKVQSCNNIISKYFINQDPLTHWMYPPPPPPPPILSIRGNITNENKTLKQILQNSCLENVNKATCVERSMLFNFYTKFVNRSLKPKKTCTGP